MCEIRFLKTRVALLEEELNFIKNLSSDKLEVPYYVFTPMVSTFTLSKKPFIIQPDDLSDGTDLAHYKFITITFDPTKFGINNDINKERIYILSILYKLIKKGFIKRVSGCFEVHKSGATHAHLTAYVEDNDYLPYLKRHFTDNPKNKVAIKVLPAKYPSVVSYMSKDIGPFFYQSRYHPSYDEFNPYIDQDSLDINCA